MRSNAIRRLTAAALALFILFTAAQPVSASQALGSNLTDRSVTLAQGTTLTSRYMWSASKSDLRAEHYITYTPGGSVTPMVYGGAYVTSSSTVSAAAAAVERQGLRVVGAINGGFFNPDSTIVGTLMTDGVVRSLDLYNYAMVGFTGDGHVFIDESVPVKTASWQTTTFQYPEPSEPAPGEPAEGESEPPADPEGIPVVTPYRQPIAGFNALRNSDDLGGLYLYNGDFNTRVNKSSSMDCVAITLTPVSGGVMTMDCSLTFAVERICDTAAGDTFNGVLAEGRYMLYANVYGGNDKLLTGLRDLRPGDLVTVTVSGASQRWEEAEYGVSGLYSLLRGGQIVSNLPTASNPYTAIGIKADGTAVFYTIDGRQKGHSVGATYAQVAQRLQELGCVTAAALDGGGSTTIGATLPGSSSFTVLNRPSGGSQRSVNNAILLTVPAGSAILDPGYYLASDTQVALTGASLDVTAKAYDAAGTSADGTSPAWTAEGGTIAGSGLSAVYTAGTAAGTYQISAGGDPLPVRVTDTLSTLAVTRQDGGAASSLTLEPGASVDLTASGTWYNLPVAMGDENVTWQADADLGTIDGQGRFTAADANVSGTITASAGGRTVSVKVTVYNGVPFTDVPIHSWYTDAVRYAVQHKLMTGTTATTFSPDMTTTRGMMMTLLARQAGVDTAGADPWYQPGMDWAVARGVSDGTNPEATITREQMAVMLYRVAGRPSADPGLLDGYPDAGAIHSDWEDLPQAMAWAVETGIITGTDDGRLDPQGDASRAEMVVLLARFFQRSW